VAGIAERGAARFSHLSAVSVVAIANCSSLHESLYSLERIHGYCLLIPLKWKARFVPSRFPQILISVERVLASRCVAVDCSDFKASCHNRLSALEVKYKHVRTNPGYALFDHKRKY
jgi:hypothetical protein